MSTIRQVAALAKRTPLHPQWLLRPRSVPTGVVDAHGLVLDIGAADRWIEAKLPPTVSYVALDYPATGRDLYAGHPDVFADGAKLPFADASFDGVLCLEVLEHVANPRAMLREVARVLKPDGRAWLSMPFLYPLHDAPFDFQRYTEFGLRRELEAAGLHVVRLERKGHAVRTAGLLASLAVAGGAYARRGWSRWLLLPLATVAVAFVNTAAWLTSLVWPDWEHMAQGHEIEVRKP